MALSQRKHVLFPNYFTKMIFPVLFRDSLIIPLLAVIYKEILTNYIYLDNPPIPTLVKIQLFYFFLINVTNVLL